MAIMDSPPGAWFMIGGGGTLTAASLVPDSNWLWIALGIVAIGTLLNWCHKRSVKTNDRTADG